MTDPVHEREHEHERALKALTALTDADIKDSTQYLTTLDEISVKLSTKQDLREALGEGHPPLWPTLLKVWLKLNDAFDEENTINLDSIANLNSCLVSIGRFTRNLCADVPANQERAYHSEPQLRELIHKHTSFYATQDPYSFPVVRMLVQTLSNIITGNDRLIEQAWTAYMNLPEEQNILIRLLAHPDDRVLTCTLIFILNCLSFNHKKTFKHLLLEKPSGIRICIAILDRMERLREMHEESEAAMAFSVAYEIFEELFQYGFAPVAMKVVTIEGEPLTPHQYILFKLLDSYIAHLSRSDLLNEIQATLLEFIIREFLELSRWAQNSFKKALKPQSPSGESGQVEGNEMDNFAQMDTLLPNVCQGLILLTECLCTYSLGNEEIEKFDDGPETTKPGTSPLATSVGSIPRLTFKSAESTRGQGSVESIISLLRLVDQFVPRVTLADRKAKDKGKGKGKAAPKPRAKTTAPAPTPAAQTNRKQEQRTAPKEEILPVAEPLPAPSQAWIASKLAMEDKLNSTSISTPELSEPMSRLTTEEFYGLSSSSNFSLSPSTASEPTIWPTDSRSGSTTTLGPNPNSNASAAQANLISNGNADGCKNGVDPAQGQYEADKDDAEDGVEDDDEDPWNGFNYLKRDLVKLLGILCYDDRAVQNRVRECGGIIVVLNLCVVDDRNPYLREHALFALRNILHNNYENKKIVNEMRDLQEQEQEREQGLKQ